MRQSMPAVGPCLHSRKMLASVSRSSMYVSPLGSNVMTRTQLAVREMIPSYPSAIHLHRSSKQPQAQSALSASSQAQRSSSVNSTCPISASNCPSSAQAPLLRCPIAQQRIRQQNGPTPADRLQVRMHSSSASSLPVPEEGKPSGSQPAWWLWALLACALAGGGYTLYGSETGIALKDWLAAGPMGQSGMLAAFSLILLSEIGDKTFFIAALLAMKLGRWISFIGSVAALSVMTAISVGIGAVCSHVPPALHSSIPIGELAGVALLIVFGIRTLRDGLKPAEPESKSDAELADAQTAVSAAQIGTKSTFSSIMEVATLIFVAEWGDRSMLATVALGASQDPLAVAAGAIAGHALATGIAVVVGAIACKYVSEKAINVISGALFLLFAAGTLYGMYIGAV